MSSWRIAVLLLLLVSCYADRSAQWKLTVIKDPDNADRLNKVIGKIVLMLDIYPTVYSSPVDNLNSHQFTVFKADPADACTKIT